VHPERRHAGTAPRDRPAPRLRTAPPGLPSGRHVRLRRQRTRPHPHRLPLGRHGRPAEAA